MLAQGIARPKQSSQHRGLCKSELSGNLIRGIAENDLHQKRFTVSVGQGQDGAPQFTEILIVPFSAASSQSGKKILAPVTSDALPGPLSQRPTNKQSASTAKPPRMIKIVRIVVASQTS